MKDYRLFLLVLLVLTPCVAFGRTVVSRAARVTNTPTSGYTYNYMYPYLNNQMRQALNPGDANAQSTSPINAVVRTAPMPNNSMANESDFRPSRRIVARSGRVVPAPDSNPTMSGNAGTARSAVSMTSNTKRNVTARSGAVRATRANINTTSNTIQQNTSGSVFVSSNRCLSDYTDCMNMYCVREDTPYNRCYCSARLSQIESEYQPQIDDLIKQILRAKDTTGWTDAEMTEYWNDRIGRYVGENSWEKLDDALNIDWPGAGERMQGQGAYLTGHQYCINHLTNCGYAAANLRDVYRSEISRDCDSYEKSLERLKTALETALDTYGGN